MVVHFGVFVYRLHCVVFVCGYLCIIRVYLFVGLCGCMYFFFDPVDMFVVCVYVLVCVCGCLYDCCLFAWGGSIYLFVCNNG